MKHQYQLAIALSILLNIWSLGKPIHAQIVPDRTINTRIDTEGNTTVITGGSIAGSNLFHSFQEFSIPQGSGAFFKFNDNQNIQNVFTRVTGSSASHIDGLLRVSGTANFFLLNPNGIIFGPNAELNIGGSFLASTASSIKFADGGEFSAIDPQRQPLLTMSVPVGLQFGNRAETIRNESRTTAFDSKNNPITVGLRVNSGQGLALVGGNLQLAGGNITAPDGRIELGSVGSGSLVGINLTSQGFVLNYPAGGNFQDISISQGSEVNASGEGVGNIQVRGRAVTVSDRSSILSVTKGNQNGGEISIRADELNMSNSSQIDSTTSSSGKAGNMNIETRRLTIKDGLYIVSGTNYGSTGDAGNLTVSATESIELIGVGTYNNRETASGLSTATVGDGNAGNLTIETNRLSLRDGGNITASSFGKGNVGSVNIRASEIEVIGVTPTSSNVSAIRAQVEGNGSGNGGKLTIETGSLIVRDGGQVAASSFGTGKAGELNVTATDFIELSGTAIINNQAEPNSSGLFASSRGDKDAGNLTIKTGRLIVSDGARVSAVSTNSGNAGNINIQADSILLNNKANISGATLSREGGNINIDSENIQLRNESGISASAGVQGGGGNGGNLSIGTETLVALENSDIRANAFTGDGGRVNITAQGIFGTEYRALQTTASDITASSTFGRQGEVTLNTPDVDPSRGLLALPEIPPDPSRLIAQGCPANKTSRFSITGRGGLPPNPSEALGTDGVVVNWVTLEPKGENISTSSTSTSVTRSTPTPSIEAQGFQRYANGDVFLTATSPTVTPYSSLSTPVFCHER